LDDTKLIIDCQNGEKQAFNDLIILYYPYVSVFCNKYFLICANIFPQSTHGDFYVNPVLITRFSYVHFHLQTSAGGSGAGACQAKPQSSVHQTEYVSILKTQCLL